MPPPPRSRSRDLAWVSGVRRSCGRGFDPFPRRRRRGRDRPRSTAFRCSSSTARDALVSRLLLGLPGVESAAYPDAGAIARGGAGASSPGHQRPAAAPTARGAEAVATPRTLPAGRNGLSRVEFGLFVSDPVVWGVNYAVIKAALGSCSRCVFNAHPLRARDAHARRPRARPGPRPAHLPPGPGQPGSPRRAGQHHLPDDLHPGDRPHDRRQRVAHHGVLPRDRRASRHGARPRPPAGSGLGRRRARGRRAGAPARLRARKRVGRRQADR